MNKIELSIIVPTYHRAELLDFKLKSLKTQYIPINYEIIILEYNIINYK